MPLVRIDMLAGKPREYRTEVGNIVYRTMMDTLGVPLHDNFHIITEHSKDDLVFNREYLGIQRSDDCIVVQITLNSGRSLEVKQRFYRMLADRLHDELGLRREDVLVNLVEVSKENWSFGNGEAQYAPAAGS